MPIICLIQIVLPSLILLYLIEEFIEREFTLKSVGHQWYWSYEYRDFYFSHTINLEFDSFIKKEIRRNIRAFRLLDVDNRIVVPLNTIIRLLVTRADVIHC